MMKLNDNGGILGWILLVICLTLVAIDCPWLLWFVLAAIILIVLPKVIDRLR